MPMSRKSSGESSSRIFFKPGISRLHGGQNAAKKVDHNDLSLVLRDDIQQMRSFYCGGGGLRYERKQKRKQQRKNYFFHDYLTLQSSETAGHVMTEIPDGQSLLSALLPLLMTGNKTAGKTYGLYSIGGISIRADGLGVFPCHYSSSHHNLAGQPLFFYQFDRVLHSGHGGRHQG